MTTYPDYWDTSILFPEAQKVCALCDKHFGPVSSQPQYKTVKVESIDGKPVTSDTYMRVSTDTYDQIVSLVRE